MASRDGNAESPERKGRWYQKLRDKYRLIILNEDTFEEKLSFRLSQLNVFVMIGMLAIIFIFLTTYLIAFTPLREYIPGYNDANVQEELYELQLKSDSLEQAFKSKDLYIANMKKILLGEDGDETVPEIKNDTAGKKSYAGITIKKSKEDSLLRVEYEKSTKYNLTNQASSGNKSVSDVSMINFYSPVKGVVTNHFNPSNQHFGVDIVAKKDEVVKAVLDGVVIFSEWSSTTGHVISVQHGNNVVSIYKHNSRVLRKQGDRIRAGESIAIIGETGEFTTGPHLHFELWINNKPVNPVNYVVF